MSRIINLLFLPAMCWLLISATTITVEQRASDAVAAVHSVVPTINSSQPGKLNFLEKLWMKRILRKMKADDNAVDADQLAKSSETWGWIAIGSLIGGLIIPLGFLFALPAGIVALSKGNRALKSGTKEEKKAKKGKLLGTISLIGFGVLTVVVLIIVATLLNTNL
jgi:hypothetical protein